MFLTVEHAGFDRSSPPEPILVETELVLDVVGYVRKVIDARDNTAEDRVFGMLQQLESNSINAGMRRVIADIGRHADTG